MSEWKEYTLGEITDFFSGGTPAKDKNEYWNGCIPWISAKTMTKYQVDSSTLNITKEGLSNGSRLAYEKDILLLVRGSGLFIDIPINIVKTPVAFNQDIKAIRAKNQELQEFVFFWLQGNKKGLNDILEETGIGAGKFDTDLLKKISISIPTNTTELNCIVQSAKSIFDKIDLLHRQNATLEQLAETLFRQWFIEEAKEEWEEKKLGELLTITSSKRIFYSEYVTKGVPFYRSKEIIELRTTGSTASELYISEKRFDEIDSKFGSPQKGDILMTSVGTLGVAYRVKPNHKFYFKDGNLTWFKDFKRLPSSIIYLWLISKIGQEELASITIGSTQQALTIEGLKSISFKIPNDETIQKYAIIFEEIISKTESNQNQIRTLTQLRDTLLPKLMSGDVRVKVEE